MILFLGTPFPHIKSTKEKECYLAIGEIKINNIDILFSLFMQHFFASVEKAKSVLGLEPDFGLVEGLTDSYNLDFGRGTFRKEADFSTDDIILGKSLVSV